MSSLSDCWKVVFVAAVVVMVVIAPVVAIVIVVVGFGDSLVQVLLLEVTGVKEIICFVTNSNRYR